MEQNIGKIISVEGSGLEIEFDKKLPAIYTALLTGDNNDLVLEVQGHIDHKTVRALALGATRGLYRGMKVTDTGDMIKVPVGDGVKGRMFNVFGQPIDNMGEINSRQKALVDGLRAMLGLTAKVTLVAPKTIVRSEGKAVRVIDKRKLHD